MAGTRPTLRSSVRRSRPRSALGAVAATTVIAVLAVVVAVLSYHSATRGPAASPAEVATLKARVDRLDRRLVAAQAAARTVARKEQASLAATRRGPGSACLTEMQREIDDLQAYLSYRTPPLRHRVTGACARLLRPRFAG